VGPPRETDFFKIKPYDYHRKRLKKARFSAPEAPMRHLMHRSGHIVHINKRLIIINFATSEFPDHHPFGLKSVAGNVVFSSEKTFDYYRIAGSKKFLRDELCE
jgi:hypothetical protein